MNRLAAATRAWAGFQERLQQALRGAEESGVALVG
jgi:hypothetical protein